VQIGGLGEREQEWSKRFGRKTLPVCFRLTEALSNCKYQWLAECVSIKSVIFTI